MGLWEEWPDTNAITLETWTDLDDDAIPWLECRGRERLGVFLACVLLRSAHDEVGIHPVHEGEWGERRQKEEGGRPKDFVVRGGKLMLRKQHQFHKLIAPDNREEKAYHQPKYNHDLLLGLAPSVERGLLSENIAIKQNHLPTCCETTSEHVAKRVADVLRNRKRF
jgi:hypothetical protein